VNDNEEWFQEIADFAPVGIAVIDAAGSVRYVNRRLAQITHRSQEALLGLDLNSFLAPEDEGDQYRCHLDAGSPCIVEVALRWINDDRRTGAVAIVDDVTERPTSLARMAAGIAHECAGTLTRMLTTHGAIEHGPAPASFDVNDLIRATVPPIVEQETAVTLSLRLSEPPTPVHMDPAHLAEALRFLTGNAIEAMPPRGGKITIVASRAGNRPAALPDGEFVHISVVDNGCGMAAESLEHATEPFFTTKAGAPWVGLGLATTHGIVNRAGGRMSIASAPGVGTTVHMYVPSRASVRQGSPPGDEGACDSRGTLLVVDDSQDLRILAARLLTNAGFEVLTAASGVEAMAILQDRTFDCLVTDIAMPEMGGIDLAESVSAVEPDMPVVFVSGFVNIPAGPGGPLPDNAHSIAKPYTPEALTAAVRRAMRARSLRAT
jgi:signal transduction histidine kinase/CheY-like chemotaxis protein